MIAIRGLAPEQRLSLMYYPDFTPYCYNERTADPNVLNIGWLEVPHPFRTKKASEELLDALFEKCSIIVNGTRGWHQCQFCDVPTWGVEISRHGKKIFLGDAEIRVKAKDGRVYAAPNLIYHYVSEHDYDPPKEFVEALLQRPSGTPIPQQHTIYPSRAFSCLTARVAGVYLRSLIAS